MSAEEKLAASTNEELIQEAVNSILDSAREGLDPEQREKLEQKLTLVERLMAIYNGICIAVAEPNFGQEELEEFRGEPNFDAVIANHTGVSLHSYGEKLKELQQEKVAILGKLGKINLLTQNET